MDKDAERLWEAQNSRALLAIHEAGHAVGATRHNVEVIPVVATGFRHCFTDTVPRHVSKETLHNELVGLYAGYQAVLKETGDQIVANAQSGYDWIYVDKHLNDLFIEKKATEGSGSKRRNSNLKKSLAQTGCRSKR